MSSTPLHALMRHSITASTHPTVATNIQTRTLCLGGLKGNKQFLAPQEPKLQYQTTNSPATKPAPDIIKDPASSATVDMTSSVTEDIKRLQEEMKRPIRTVWAQDGKGEVGFGAVRMGNGDWKI